MPTRYELVPDESQVWIEGSSSVHPIRATATGVTGWVELTMAKAGIRVGSQISGEVRVDVERLESGNTIVDRETRRRIDARKFPEIVGTAVASEYISAERISIEGDLAFRGEIRRVHGELSVSLFDASSRSDEETGAVLLEGMQRFDVRDWDLQPPKLGLLKVHPDIDVRVRLVANPV